MTSRCIFLCSIFLASGTGWQKLHSLLHLNFSKHSILCSLCSHLTGKESLSCRLTQFGNTVPGISGCPQVRLSCICCHIRPKAKPFVQHTRTNPSERLAQVLSAPALSTLGAWNLRGYEIPAQKISPAKSHTEVADQGCIPVPGTYPHL